MKLNKKDTDLTKVISVIFSCNTQKQVDVAENMYYNWQKFYDDDDTYTIALISLKRQWLKTRKRNER